MRRSRAAVLLERAQVAAAGGSAQLAIPMALGTQEARGELEDGRGANEAPGESEARPAPLPAEDEVVELAGEPECGEALLPPYLTCEACTSASAPEPVVELGDRVRVVEGRFWDRAGVVVTICSSTFAEYVYVRFDPNPRERVEKREMVARSALVILTKAAEVGPAPREEASRAQHANLTIAKCLVNGARPTPELVTLLPYQGPDGVLLAQAWAAQGEVNNRQIVGYASESTFFAVETRRFDRVILWSDEIDLDEERAYFLHGYELLKAGGKLVAAISTELSTDRSFRMWASKKGAAFDEPGGSFRSRSLVMVTVWKSA